METHYSLTILSNTLSNYYKVISLSDPSGRGLRRRSEAVWLLGTRVRIPLGAWMFVSCVYMLCCPV
jgi:hypothetical protein